MEVRKATGNDLTHKTLNKSLALVGKILPLQFLQLVLVNIRKKYYEFF